MAANGLVEFVITSARVSNRLFDVRGTPAPPSIAACRLVSLRGRGPEPALVLERRRRRRNLASSSLAWSMAEKWPSSGFIRKPAIALVADQRPVALLQLPSERGQDAALAAASFLIWSWLRQTM